MDEETSPILIELKTPEARHLNTILREPKKRYKLSKQVQNTVNMPVEDRALFQWKRHTRYELFNNQMKVFVLF